MSISLVFTDSQNTALTFYLELPADLLIMYHFFSWVHVLSAFQLMDEYIYLICEKLAGFYEETNLLSEHLLVFISSKPSNEILGVKHFITQFRYWKATETN